MTNVFSEKDENVLTLIDKCHNQSAEKRNKTSGPSPCTCSTEPFAESSCLRSVRGAWQTVTYEETVRAGSEREHVGLGASVSQ